MGAADRGSVQRMADEILQAWDGAVDPDRVEKLARECEEAAAISLLGEEFELRLAAELRRRAAALRIIL
jgi:hypothetical protein